MTELLRRFLWSLPLLFLSAIVLFFVLGRTAPAKTHLSLPLFYNPNPMSAEIATERALDELLSAGSSKTSARESLVELGGAALPTLLDEMPSLSVSERRVVAEALWPVAERMGLAERPFWGARPGVQPGERSTDQKLLFWESYREEHALDLRPQSVTRLVRRVSEQEADLRSADLLAVDTYALPTLVEALGRVRDERDVRRVARVVSKISHVTDKPFELEADATVFEAKKVATEVRWFFDEHGAKWSEKSRVEMLVARISQTEFALWLFRLTRQVAGLDESRLFDKLAASGWVTLPLWLAALLGLLVLGPTLSATLLVIQLKESRWKLERLGLRTGLAAALMFLVPLLVRPRTAEFSELVLVALSSGTVFSTFVLQRELSDRTDWRTHFVLRKRSVLSRTLAVARWLAPSIPTMTPIAVAEAALWVTALEVATSTRGIGYYTILAAQEGDLYLLMLVCLGLGAITGISQVLADLFLGPAQNTPGEA